MKSKPHVCRLQQSLPLYPYRGVGAPGSGRNWAVAADSMGTFEFSPLDDALLFFSPSPSLSVLCAAHAKKETEKLCAEEDL